ncbi:MAG: FG-GAP-like repeat-containing protein [bacterium]
MKKTILLIIATFMCLAIWKDSAFSTVTFSRFTISDNVKKPHGDWAGDVENNNPKWEYDAFATIVDDYQAVWYSNLGKGMTWGAKNVIYTGDRWCLEIVAGDLDKDGWIDAVSSFVQSAATAISFLAVHKNNGNGTFTTTVLPTHTTRFRQIKLEDINNDTWLDIVVSGSAPSASLILESGLYWYKNNGSMSFTENFIGTCNGWKVDCFDDEGDKHLEIAVTEEFFGANGTSPARLLVYKNNGAEGFAQIVVDNLGLHMGDPPGGGGVRCADFDGDSRKDLLAGASNDGKLYWYKNNGGASFTKYTVDASASKVDGIDVGDFEPDGDMDIVACGRDYWIRWYENDGFGNFTSHSIDVQYILFDLPYVTYLDGDSCPDIIVTEATATTGHVFAYLNPCSGVGTEENKIKTTGNWLKMPSIVTKNSINITFGIENKSRVKLEVLDITGRVIDVINDANYDKGSYKTLWNTNEKPNGTYFLSLKAENCPIVTKRITLIR